MINGWKMAILKRTYVAIKESTSHGCVTRCVRAQYRVSHANSQLLRIRRLHVRSEPHIYIQQIIYIPLPITDLVGPAHFRGVQPGQNAVGTFSS